MNRGRRSDGNIMLKKSCSNYYKKNFILIDHRRQKLKKKLKFFLMTLIDVLNEGPNN